MDFIDDIFKLMPIPVAVVVMFISLAISKGIKRDAEGRLPWWFIWIPFGIGFGIGIPGHFTAHLGELLIQPIWLTIVYALQQGMIYGATSIGLWSGRKIIPYFRKVENGNSNGTVPTDKHTQS
jgi:hypothetical protein